MWRFKIHFFIFIELFIILKTLASEFIVSSRDEFLSALNSINGNTTIIINGHVKFDDNSCTYVTSSTNSGAITIKGLNGKESVLEYRKHKKGFIFANITSIELSDLTYYGLLQFSKLDLVYVHDVDHIGLVDTFGTTDDGYILFKNYNFTSSDSQYSRAKSVQFTDGGRVFVEDSVFTSSPGCTEALVRYNGKNSDIHEFTVKNSIFNCEHYSNGIIVQVGNFTLNDSKFYNGFSSKQGAFMTVRDAYAIIKNCTFENGYSEVSGGVFNTLNNIYFEASDIEAYNITSYSNAGLFYEESKYPEYISVLKNIKYVNLWKEHPNNGSGSIITIYNLATVYIYNLYSEGLYCIIFTCTLFNIQDQSRAIIENVYVNKIHGIETGLVFYIASPQQNGYIKANNCTITNIEQESSEEGTTVVYSDGGTMDLTK
ncbi:hypothetical protein BCR36DRAFT_463248 [Piromyces finnis]|uniref:Right handed beta helix domain-containing protein n=1 Tax=Piromyces finnis TaxID=1754191 RepID=A0A1Y1UYY2_9FUNG|nr:hypothetical protein BCR36DRAFT_463248 [Piromyces finnis]|eukprot:ORX42544.1 hypothetical protein BCR36DRAFT_463248 [Piromyces finnis]